MIFDDVFLAIYVVECLLKAYAYRMQYLKDHWNVLGEILICIPSRLPAYESLINVIIALQSGSYSRRLESAMTCDFKN